LHTQAGMRFAISNIVPRFEGLISKKHEKSVIEMKKISKRLEVSRYFK